MNNWFYLVFNGFTTQGFNVPDALKTRTDFLLTVREIVTWFLGFTGTVSFLIILWAAFTLVTAAGNDDKVKKARSGFVYAFIGIVIIAVSYAFVNFLTYNLSPEVLDRPQTTTGPRISAPVSGSSTPVPTRLGSQNGVLHNVDQSIYRTVTPRP